MENNKLSVKPKVSIVSIAIFMGLVLLSLFFILKWLIETSNEFLKLEQTPENFKLYQGKFWNFKISYIPFHNYLYTDYETYNLTNLGEPKEGGAMISIVRTEIAQNIAKNRLLSIFQKRYIVPPLNLIIGVKSLYTKLIFLMIFMIFQMK